MLLFLLGHSAFALAVGSSVNGAALYRSIPGATASCANALCHGPDPSENRHGFLKAANNPAAIAAAIQSVPAMAVLTGRLTQQQLEDIAAYLGSGDPVNGRSLYRNIPGAAATCSNAFCHGPDPGENRYGFLKAANNPAAIEGALQFVPPMAFLRDFLGKQQIKDLAAYLAGDPINGRALYQNLPGAPASCSSAFCHGPDPTLNAHGFLKAANNPAAIENAIQIVPPMGFLRNFLNRRQISDVAAFLANPTALPAEGFPARLDFGNQRVASAGVPQSILFTNSGSARVSIASIAASGDFAQTNSCAGALDPAKSCTIVVTFTPSGEGLREGELRVVDDSSPSPKVVALSGTGASAPSNAGGGGCTVGPSAPLDPVLAGLPLLALLRLTANRRRAHIQSSSFD